MGELKYERDGNLIYTKNKDGNNDIMLNVTTQPRNAAREVVIARRLQDILKQAKIVLV